MSQIIITQGGALTATSLGSPARDSRTTAGALGPWLELIASTDYDAIGAYIFMRATGAYWNYELGIGGSGAEVSMGALGCAAASTPNVVFYAPFLIPAGSRLSVRGQTTSSYSPDSLAVAYLVRGQSTDKYSAQRGALYGVTAGAWTTLDAGAAANTKSGYTEIVASTTTAAKGFSLYFATAASQTVNNLGYLADFAIGAAAAEVVVLPNLFLSAKGYDYAGGPNQVGPIWTPIPAGTRLSMRLQCDSTTSTERKIMAAVILWE